MNSDDKGFLDIIKDIFECLLSKLGGGSGKGSGGGFLDIIKPIFTGLFSQKSFNGQNEFINKSTGQVVSCNELKTFISNEYNKYLQNPSDYQ